MEKRTNPDRDSAQDKLATRREQYAESKRKQRAAQKSRHVSVSISPDAHQQLTALARKNHEKTKEVIEGLIKKYIADAIAPAPSAPIPAPDPAYSVAPEDEDDEGSEEEDAEEKGRDEGFDELHHQNAILKLGPDSVNLSIRAHQQLEKMALDSEMSLAEVLETLLDEKGPQIYSEDEIERACRQESNSTLDLLEHRNTLLKLVPEDALNKLVDHVKRFFCIEEE